MSSVLSTQASFHSLYANNRKETEGETVLWKGILQTKLGLGPKQRENVKQHGFKHTQSIKNDSLHFCLQQSLSASYITSDYKKEFVHLQSKAAHIL